MKITYEFDTDSEGWKEYGEDMKRDQFEASFGMLMALDKILSQTREWYKYDQRSEIPVEELRNTIDGIIEEYVPNIEKLRYG